MVERIPFREGAPPRAVRKRIQAALAAGELIALPTETVYGLAARADHPEALERLARVKGGGGERPWTWHVGSREALERFPQVSGMARRLAARYWPGPLTLVLPGVPAGLESVARDDWTGVRLPAHAGAAKLIDAQPFPLVASSANLAGGEPLRDADAVQAAFGEQLAFLLDGGPTRMGEPSLVLRLGRGRFEVLRPGILDVEALRSVAGLRIGFVCTGNTCRSPMAEALARELVARRLETSPAGLADFGFEFVSMGVMAGPGAPASPHAVAVLAREGVDLSGHRSRPALPEEVARLDRVYALTASHLEALRMQLPPGGARHCQLLDPAGSNVPDPIGGSAADYERTAEAIRAMLRARIDEWV